MIYWPGSVRLDSSAVETRLNAWLRSTGAMTARIVLMERTRASIHVVSSRFSQMALYIEPNLYSGMSPRVSSIYVINADIVKHHMSHVTYYNGTSVHCQIANCIVLI
jgi:hypothetical protein